MLCQRVRYLLGLTQRLARDLDLSKLARTTQVVGLAEVPAVVGRMFEGKVRGRTVVDVNA